MKNDGGPAFPTDGLSVKEGHIYQTGKSSGMSLRDYFAAAALAGSIEGVYRGVSQDEVITVCWEMADAMIARMNKEAS